MKAFVTNIQIIAQENEAILAASYSILDNNSKLVVLSGNGSTADGVGVILSINDTPETIKDKLSKEIRNIEGNVKVVFISDSIGLL